MLMRVWGVNEGVGVVWGVNEGVGVSEGVGCSYKCMVCQYEGVGC